MARTPVLETVDLLLRRLAMFNNFLTSLATLFDTSHTIGELSVRCAYYSTLLVSRPLIPWAIDTAIETPSSLGSVLLWFEDVQTHHSNWLEIDGAKRALFNAFQFQFMMLLME
jgi:hypothetical protein